MNIDRLIQVGIVTPRSAASAVRYHLHQQRVALRPFVLLPQQPGKKLYIDFAGKPLGHVDKYTGEEIRCPVLSTCPPFPDDNSVMVVRSLTTENFSMLLHTV